MPVRERHEDDEKEYGLLVVRSFRKYIYSYFLSFFRWFAPEGVDAFFFLEVRVGGEGSSEVFLDLGGHR